MGMTRRASLFLFLTLVLPCALTAQPGADQYKLGKARYDSSKWDDAVQAFEKAVKADDKNAEYHLWLARGLGEIAQRANVFRQAYLAKRVKSEFEKTVQLDPSSIGGHDGLRTFYAEAPGVMGGSMAKAREEAEAIARVNPMRGHFARAANFNKEKDTVAYERELRAAVTEFPDSLTATATLVNWLVGKKREPEAFAAIDKYVARRPGDILGAWWIGRTAAITGKELDRGEQALKKVLASYETDTTAKLLAPASVHFRMGDIHAKKGDKARARAEYEEALKLNPKLDAARRALNAL